jgi:DNA mismatch repair protein MutS
VFQTSAEIKPRKRYGQCSKKTDTMTKICIDKQTSLDLNIFSLTSGDSSIFDYFNQTQTKGGKDVLEDMMRTPLNDLKEIKARISDISFVIENNIICNLNKEHLVFIEHYLNQNIPILNSNPFELFYSSISNKLKPSNDIYVVSKGLEFLKLHFETLLNLFNKMASNNIPIFFTQFKNKLNALNENPEFKFFLESKNQPFSFRQLNRFDLIIRQSEKKIIREIINFSYLLDAYISIANTSLKNKLCFPVFIESTKTSLKIDDLFHPFLNNPVKNDVCLFENKNLCFLTGANMAGKSTYLKSIGLCVYLSHLGFPIPASSMETVVFNGLYTTINISDNINKGYSHYYSEVKRIKEIALMLKEKKRLFVIFDELFRGTNVKDAYDGTLLITNGFSKIQHSLFYISSHIIEVGQALEISNNVLFKCFESKLTNEQPVYNYKLIDGISSERLGLAILKNEGVLEIIDSIVNDSK